MFESIKQVKEQFEWTPEILGGFENKNFRKVIVCGMGGSNLASGFLEMLRPDLDILSHRNYGLPENVSKADLIITSSYSGNTEETLDSFGKAVSGGFNVIAIAIGGKLLEMAKEKNIPHIQVPKTDIEPRMALGYSLLAFLKAVGDEENLKKAKEFSANFHPGSLEKEGKTLAEKLQGRVPIIYSSWENKAIAYAWKIKFNETAKIPAFFNVFPELNHNEIVGFLSQVAAPEGVCGGTINPYFIFLKDPDDHPRIQKRIEITAKLLKEKGFSDHSDVKLGNSDRFSKIFNSLALADWASYCLAQNLRFNPEDSQIIEEFKKELKKIY